MQVVLNALVSLRGDRSSAEITVRREGDEVLLVARPRHSREGEGQPWVVATSADHKDRWGFPSFERAFDFALNKAHALAMAPVEGS